MVRDEAHLVSPETLDALRTFVCDGSSPFFGRSPETAYREIVALEHLVEAGPQSAPAPIVRIGPATTDGRLALG
jgi:hypothetical protein